MESFSDSFVNGASLRKRMAKKAWAKERGTNMQMVLRHVDGLLLQGYPEHKRCVMEVLQDDVGLLLWIAFRILGDSEEAHDCTIDALTKACRSLQKRSIEAVHEIDLKRWLCACVHRRALTVWRKEHHFETVSLQEAEAVLGSEDLLWSPGASTRANEHPDQVVVYEDACRELVVMLRRLSWAQASAIVMHYVDGEPYRKIAEARGGSDKAVNMTVIRGLRSLRVMAEAVNLRASDFWTEGFSGVLFEILDEAGELWWTPHVRE